ncbi:MAG: Exopolyphosphatase [bacterium]|nr:Exopolyphosphatase [bacterium]
MLLMTPPRPDTLPEDRLAANGEQALLPGVPRPVRDEKIHPLANQLVASIDVGSNAMRLRIARVTSTGGLIPVVDHREAVRLGADAFRDKLIGPQTFEETVLAFRRFQSILEAYPVARIRGVATSAMREAQNSLAIIDRLYEETGIQLEIITPLEEAELVVRAVTRSLEQPGDRLLIVDVGGGSIEVSLVDHGRIVAIEGFSVGTVRMLQFLADQRADERDYPALIQAHLAFMRNRLERVVQQHPVDTVVAIGGNAGAIAALVESGGQAIREETREDRQTQRIPREKLREMTELIDGLLIGQRTTLLGLADRRADVIQPAAHLYLTTLEVAGKDELVVPGVGVRDGILWQMVDPHLAPEVLATQEEQVVQMAHDIAERFRADMGHAEQVSWMAGRLFDDLTEIHRLPADDRSLLLAAAILHDVGHLVNHGKHHLHSYYLIRHADFYGLAPRDQEIVALVGRFHRKGEPMADRHPEFAALTPPDRVRVMKLSALLRLADALDRTHNRVVSSLSAAVTPEGVQLTISGPDGAEIERWALERSAGIFRRVFFTQLTLQIAEAPAS